MAGTLPATSLQDSCHVADNMIQRGKHLYGGKVTVNHLVVVVIRVSAKKAGAYRFLITTSVIRNPTTGCDPEKLDLAK